MTSAAGPLQTCPPCDEPDGHQYDDDRHSLLYGLSDWSRVGDPCMWCDHQKCPQCPAPRGGTFAEEHAAGNEECWDFGCDLPLCQRWQARQTPANAGPPS